MGVCVYAGQIVDTNWPPFTFTCGGEKEGIETYCHDDRRQFALRVCWLSWDFIWEQKTSQAFDRAPCRARAYLPPRCCSGSPGLRLEMLFF